MTNMAKEVQNRDKGEADASLKAAKAKPQKKPGQQPAGKKPEAARKSVKRSDERRFAWVEQLRQYLREVAYELRKVVWPSRKETIGTTSVVLIIVFICGLYLGMIDYLLSMLVGTLLG
jgi:preprotein translocase subunit SecE